jgi:hypothetical protein
MWPFKDRKKENMIESVNWCSEVLFDQMWKGVERPGSKRTRLDFVEEKVEHLEGQLKKAQVTMEALAGVAVGDYVIEGAAIYRAMTHNIGMERLDLDKHPEWVRVSPFVSKMDIVASERLFGKQEREEDD